MDLRKKSNQGRVKDKLLLENHLCTLIILIINTSESMGVKFVGTVFL